MEEPDIDKPRDHDPLRLFGEPVDSQHCTEAKAIIQIYDPKNPETVSALCKCGQLYDHALNKQ